MDTFISRKLVVDAGNDAYGKPILAFYGSQFPPKTEHSYTYLFDLIIARMNRVASQDYTIVFFVPGMQHRPSLEWIRKAYSTLRHEYRKNLRKLYVVYPSWWFRCMLFMMKDVFSSKFERKITNVNSLKELQELLPTAEFNFPHAVIEYDQKRQAKDKSTTDQVDIIRRTSRTSKSVFGQPITHDTFPDSIDQLLKYLERTGPGMEDIFRRSPDNDVLCQLKDSLDNGKDIDFSEYDIYNVASLLKLYVRELPTPLLNPSTYRFLDQLPFEVDRNKFVRERFPVEFELLRRILKLLKLISVSSTCHMSAHSLAVVWTPNLIRHSSVEDDLRRIKASHLLVELLIINSS